MVELPPLMIACKIIAPATLAVFKSQLVSEVRRIARNWSKALELNCGCFKTVIADVCVCVVVVCVGGGGEQHSWHVFTSKHWQQMYG